MLATNAARAASVRTGHDSQIDRAGGAIGLSPSIPPKPPATASQERTAYLLAELRCAALRPRLAACEIDGISIALRGGMIDSDTAVAWLHDCGVLDYVTPAPPHCGAP